MALAGKTPPANAGDIRDTGSIPGSGGSPGGGNSSPLLWTEEPGGLQSMRSETRHGRSDRALSTLKGETSASCGSPGSQARGTAGRAGSGGWPRSAARWGREGAGASARSAGRRGMGASGSVSTSSGQGGFGVELGEPGGVGSGSEGRRWRRAAWRRRSLGACRLLGPNAEPHWCDSAWTPHPGATEGHLPSQPCCLKVGRPRGHRAETTGSNGGTQRCRLPPQLSAHTLRGQLGGCAGHGLPGLTSPSSSGLSGAMGEPNAAGFPPALRTHPAGAAGRLPRTRAPWTHLPVQLWLVWSNGVTQRRRLPPSSPHAPCGGSWEAAQDTGSLDSPPRPALACHPRGRQPGRLLPSSVASPTEGSAHMPAAVWVKLTVCCQPPTPPLSGRVRSWGRPLGYRALGSGRLGPDPDPRRTGSQVQCPVQPGTRRGDQARDTGRGSVAQGAASASCPRRPLSQIWKLWLKPGARKGHRPHEADPRLSSSAEPTAGPHTPTHPCHQEHSHPSEF